ncbi:MAG: PilN domain-containing protein [Candidatus Paceibacterota bacterium]
MFNLIPKSAKKIISKDYKIRRWVVVLTFVIFVQLSLMVFLLPSLVLSYFKDKDLSEEVQSAKESVLSKDAAAISKVITSTNTSLDLYENLFSYPQVVPQINKIISYKNQSLKFTDFLYQSTGTSTSLITVRGIASTRDSLVLLVRNLEESGVFYNVDLPVSNLAKDRNIDFSVSLYFKE